MSNPPTIYLPTQARTRGQPEDEDALDREREIVLLAIEASVDKAVQHMRFIAREQELLQHHKQQQEMQRAEVFRTGVEANTASAAEAKTQHAHHHNHSAQGPSSAEISGPTVEPYRPFKVHRINDKDDTSAPIPEHIKDYMQHVRAPAKPTVQQQQMQQRQHLVRLSS